MVKEDLIAEIKKNLKTKKLLMGARTTLKEMKQDNLAKVLLASNCPKEMQDDVEYYAKMLDFEVIKLDVANDELGVICKRQHTITVLGLVK